MNLPSIFSVDRSMIFFYAAIIAITGILFSIYTLTVHSQPYLPPFGNGNLSNSNKTQPGIGPLFGPSQNYS
jgi:hypothetical protein